MLSEDPSNCAGFLWFTKFSALLCFSDFFFTDGYSAFVDVISFLFCVLMWYIHFIFFFKHFTVFYVNYIEMFHVKLCVGCVCK